MPPGFGCTCVDADCVVQAVRSRATTEWPDAVFRGRAAYEENAVKSSNKLFIFTGVALALVAVLMVITMSSGGNKTTAQDEKDTKIKVVKAAVDLEPFTVLSMADVVVEEMARDEVPADAASDVALVVGQAYKLGAVKGDIILSSQLQPPGISNSIAEGKRAISLEADNQALMSGLVVDGDYIDIVFKARVDVRRIIQVPGIEVEEDATYTLQDIGSGLCDDSADGAEETETYGPVSCDTWEDNQQFQGAPGSEFTVSDAGGQLEPVTKMLIQDVKVIRVIAPGVKFDAQGQQVQQSPDETTNVDDVGQLIIEVTPQQAEAIAFMQDQNHSYEVTVRGEGDHELVNTTGITFEILIGDEVWSLPYPQPMFRPGEYNLPTNPEGPNLNLEPENTKQ